jgi:hypothetical protein
MKMNIVGFEVIAGNAKATGKAYDMSRVHTLIPLAQSERASGCVGTSYDCPAHVLDKLKGCVMPIVCEVNMVDVQQYGRRVQQISAIAPASEPLRKAA